MAKKRRLPTALIESHGGVIVTPYDGLGQYLNGEMKLTRYTCEHLDAGNVPRLEIATIYNELLHAWMDKVAYRKANGEAKWLIDLMKREGMPAYVVDDKTIKWPLPKNVATGLLPLDLGLVMVEEAMSETLNSIVLTVSNQIDFGKRRAVDITNVAAAPQHTEPGEEFEKCDPMFAKRQISRVMVIATIWIWENGVSDPRNILGHTNIDGALEEWYSRRWDPERAVDSRVNRRGQPINPSLQPPMERE